MENVKNIINTTGTDAAQPLSGDDAVDERFTTNDPVAELGAETEQLTLPHAEAPDSLGGASAEEEAETSSVSLAALEPASRKRYRDDEEIVSAQHLAK